MAILHDEAYYKSRIPKPDLGLVHNFLRFIWDSEEKMILGRTTQEWVTVVLFYICFFSVLGSIFALQMWLSIYYIKQLDEPYFQYHDLPRFSHSNNFPLFRQFGNPGIDFKPNIILPKSPIIWVDNSSMKSRPQRYIETLTDFLQEYNKSKENYNTDMKCSDEAPISYTDMKPCFFDIQRLGVCGEPPYGYTYPLQPCVFIKFNKRFDWIPFHYNKSSELPKNMPYTLRESVRSSNKLQIWLSCEGANNVDKDHIGEIEYLPNPGFPVHYFPFAGQPDYLAPIVALRFKNITRKPLHITFRLLTVECNLWALNINEKKQSALDFQIILGES